MTVSFIHSAIIPARCRQHAEKEQRTRGTPTLDEGTAFGEVEQELLLQVGNRIRDLKLEQIKTDDLKEHIHAQVQTLNELKERHCELVLAEIRRCSEDNDRVACLVQLLPSKIAKDLNKKCKQKAKQQQAVQEKQFDVHRGVDDVMCQRKIPNLMAHEGKGDTFRYFPIVNPNVEFTIGDRVYLTEKMDGTTMQATKNGIYKRYDRKGARETQNWHSLSQEERYTLKRVDLENRANQYIAQAVSPYLDRFSKLPDGICIYFEALSPRVGKRFVNVELPDTIEVFDSSQNGSFHPFERTVGLCERFDLPVVALTCGVTEFNLAHGLDRLSQPDLKCTGYAAPLEGSVVQLAGKESRARSAWTT